MAYSLQTSASTNCGDLTADAGGYGPWDYMNAQHRRDKIPIIEKLHFTVDVEQLKKGATGSIGGDLDYVLRHVPNHHRALHSMARLAVQEKTQTLKGTHYAVDCYFDRAIRFKPNDGIVKMIHGIYLYKEGRLDDAIERLLEAERLENNNAYIKYNLGLLFFEKKDYERARRYADQSYAMGVQLPGLKKKLKGVGK
jgi:Tfp pilus assembly protein PilF